MAEPNLIYKVTVLRILSRADFAVSNTQLTDFFLDMNYTDYFTIQQTIGDLVESDMLLVNASHNSTLYTLSKEGERTLEAFKDKLTDAIDNDIKKYFAEHSLAMKQENSVTANFDKSTSGGYIVECKVTSDSKELLSFRMHVATKEQAEAMCYNWKVKYEDVQMSLLDILIQ